MHLQASPNPNPIHPPPQVVALEAYAQRAVVDASFMLDPHVSLFEDDDVVHREVCALTCVCTI